MNLQHHLQHNTKCHINIPHKCPSDIPNTFQGKNTSSYLSTVQSHQPICILMAFILMGMGMSMVPFVKWNLECVWNITGTFMRYVNVTLFIVLQAVLQIHYNINFSLFCYTSLLFAPFIIAPHGWTPLVPPAKTSLYIWNSKMWWLWNFSYRRNQVGTEDTSKFCAEMAWWWSSSSASFIKASKPKSISWVRY